MPKVTTHYGIPDPVPFVDVDITADNRMFLDPHAIRLAHGPLPFARDAIDCADSFLNEVIACILSGSIPDMHRGKNLLQHFAEPWETRLGMSEAGYYGHGGADGIGTLIWETMLGDVEALVRLLILKQLEDLPLFVEGVDRDITSDVTTRIVFAPLGRLTESMVAKYPQFTAGTHEVKTVERQVWNPGAREWDVAQFDLPVADGKPLLLVPAGWARPTLLMSAGRFYETAVLSYAQLEQAVRTKKGKLLKTPKDKLKEQSGLGRGRGTNLRVTLRAFDHQDDLLAEFKAFVASQYLKNESSAPAA